jgi:hypothetical protein
LRAWGWEGKVNGLVSEFMRRKPTL